MGLILSRLWRRVVSEARVFLQERCILVILLEESCVVAVFVFSLKLFSMAFLTFSDEVAGKIVIVGLNNAGSHF